ncbi:sugar phosphate isomerase/epimerase family protein [Alicyclobacillus fastidiosus]|uniref:Sugar phosphate isomerase/epimerase n=1 Tax=Alicyclobacillus fastidiosus TaxID=392011 RepID=A0ABV5ABH6_9BACL|nr:sugar phosphate isomerase/epimerase [Alicyclobacillus fastidiosus]WEH07656.1 sugar phosphate isomerase/epimerase [Alicyclobacillus fastidiosus]
MDVGIVTRSFPELTNAEAAELIASAGFRWIELCFSQTDSNYWVYNGRSDLTDLSDAKSKAIVSEYRNRGLEITSLGVFTNLLEPDDVQWKENLAYFDRLMEIAAVNEIPVVATECGFIPGHRGINADFFESRFARLCSALQWLTERASQYDLDVALEPCVLDVVPSAKRAVDLIQQVGSKRLKILLDPANFIANNTEEEMFLHLSPYVAYFHGKDRDVNAAKGCAVGDGHIDWHKFIECYQRCTPGVPFILEYVTRDNFCDIRDRVLALEREVTTSMPQ